MSIHDKIMSIPSRNPYKEGTPGHLAYEQGRCDMRDDAIELAEEAVSDAHSEPLQDNDYRYFISGKPKG